LPLGHIGAPLQQPLGVVIVEHQTRARSKPPRQQAVARHLDAFDLNQIVCTVAQPGRQPIGETRRPQPQSHVGLRRE